MNDGAVSYLALATLVLSCGGRTDLNGSYDLTDAANAPPFQPPYSEGGSGDDSADLPSAPLDAGVGVDSSGMPSDVATTCLLDEDIFAIRGKSFVYDGPMMTLRNP